MDGITQELVKTADSLGTETIVPKDHVDGYTLSPILPTTPSPSGSTRVGGKPVHYERR